MRRSWVYLSLSIAFIAMAWPAAAQVRYDEACRPLPPPGWMMIPQPPNQECLRERAEAAREAAAAARANRARAAAAARAKAERLAIEEQHCANATADDVRATIEQDPSVLGNAVKVLDVAAPHFVGETCRAEIMTTRGLIRTTLTFQAFNGRQYIQVRPVRNP